MGKIHIPRGPGDVMTILALDGFESYVVGGCVRDSLLGLEPHDWDICTNATPQEVLDVFAKRNIKTVETGIKHGIKNENEDAGVVETALQYDDDTDALETAPIVDETNYMAIMCECCLTGDVERGRIAENERNNKIDTYQKLRRTMREPFIVVILLAFLVLFFHDNGNGPSGFPELVKG